MRESISNPDKNVEFNKKRWGDLQGWHEKDQYGYRWAGGVQQSVGGMARFADKYLKPYTNQRYDHSILELSPGAGRFTSEVIRYADSIDLLDMNQACLDICMERFKYYPVPLRTFLNDGKSCETLEDRPYSMIVCFDSMVHMHPDIIEGYVRQLGKKLAKDGVMWLDHSGRGVREMGHRTDMTDKRMREIGENYGLKLVNQSFRNDHDCITVFQLS